MVVTQQTFFPGLGYSQLWLTYTHLHAVRGSIMLLQHQADMLPLPFTC
jgi:hypothetical protein